MIDFDKNKDYLYVMTVAYHNQSPIEMNVGTLVTDVRQVNDRIVYFKIKNTFTKFYARTPFAFVENTKANIKGIEMIKNIELKIKELTNEKIELLEILGTTGF